MRTPSRVLVVWWTVFMTLAYAPMSGAEEPIDLFADAPKLSDGFVRIGAWNMRHINVEGGAGDFLPGVTRDEDFVILYATFAKAIRDLGLDLVLVTEVKGSDRIDRIVDALNVGLAGGGAWRGAQTHINFVPPSTEIQLGMLWNSDIVTINPDDADVLDGQRQSSSLRAPWLIPASAGALQLDLILIHFKASQEPPQQDEVDELSAYLRARLASSSPRHVIVCGDWNIRPDNATGRERLRQLGATATSAALPQ